MIGPDELIVGLGQIDDSFDQADDCTESASEDSDDDRQDAFGGVAKHELVDPQAAEKDS